MRFGNEEVGWKTSTFCGRFENDSRQSLFLEAEDRWSRVGSQVGV